MRIQILASTVAVVFGLASTTGFAAEQNGPPKAAAKIDSVQAMVPNPELLYTPIAPCRAFGAQTIPATGTKNFLVAGAASFTSQGGPATGCGVPLSAKSVTINLTAGNTTYPGYLTAFAVGAPRPAITTLTLQNGNITNSTMVALGAAAGNISIYSNKTATVFGDVTGYFAPQIVGLIAASTDPFVYTGSRFLSVSRISKGNYSVVVDRDVTYCTFNTQPSYYDKHITNAQGFSGSQFNFSIYEKADNGVVTYFDNDYVYVSVHC